MSFFKPWEPGIEAKKIVKNAQRDHEYAKNKVEIAMQSVKYNLEQLGKKKLEIYKIQLNKFVSLFEKIKNVELTEFPKLNRHIEFSNSTLPAMREANMQAIDFGKGVASAAAAGSLAGFGALGTAITIGSASTGTAISTLSGAAFSNALLAWFGGGALSAGGLGMAGGTLVLAGVFAAPVLLVFPAVWNTLGKKKLEQAKEFQSKAKVAILELNTQQALAESITERSIKVLSILSKLEKNFRDFLSGLNDLVEQSTDYRSYSKKNKEALMVTAVIAKTMMTIIETPIIAETGKVYDDKGKVDECRISADKLLADSSLFDIKGV